MNISLEQNQQTTQHQLTEPNNTITPKYRNSDPSLNEKPDSRLPHAFTRLQKRTGLSGRSLISMASHHFRTPLTIIQSNIDLMDILVQQSNPELSERYGCIKSDIEGEIQNMIGMLEDLIMLGNFSDQIYPYTPSLINPRNFLDDLIHNYQTDFSGCEVTGISFQQHCQDIMLDTTLLRLAITKLIENIPRICPDHAVLSLDAEQDCSGLTIRIIASNQDRTDKKLFYLIRSILNGSLENLQRSAYLGFLLAKVAVEYNKGSLSIQKNEDKGCFLQLYFPR